jgi:hypothetical protein
VIKTNRLTPSNAREIGGGLCVVRGPVDGRFLV